MDVDRCGIAEEQRRTEKPSPVEQSPDSGFPTQISNNTRLKSTPYLDTSFERHSVKHRQSLRPSSSPLEVPTANNYDDDSSSSSSSSSNDQYGGGGGGGASDCGNGFGGGEPSLFGNSSINGDRSSESSRWCGGGGGGVTTDSSTTPRSIQQDSSGKDYETTTTNDNAKSDPPFHTSGHAYIGKRVPIFFKEEEEEGEELVSSKTSTSSPLSSSLTPVDGTVTGFLSRHDKDSAGAPAFTCTRTNRPAALFHVVFDAGNEYFKHKDVEEWEFKECCTWLHL